MNSGLEARHNVKQAVPFFMVVSMDRSLDFYVEKLGFTLKHQWQPNGKIEWCCLQLGNASIMLQEYRQPPAERLGKGVSVCFICEDALAIYNQIVVNQLPVSEPFVGNNMWVVELKDPDGYHILFESPTAVPEETMYSDWVKTNRAN
ncbi:VOC family protein [Foetidibacter luteolus]|uniref:VOC family protein n=1 Tax=Foetidibacter luteolus TaxID=2608880 RepID=UPI00129A0E69|nr:VOC family protein [Foetidibacter luteolus]